MNEYFYIEEENKFLNITPETVDIPENAIKLTIEKFNEAIEKLQQNFSVIVVSDKDGNKTIDFVPPPQPLIEDIFKIKLNTFNNIVSSYSEAEVNKLLNYAPQVEKDTWALKLAAAQKILSNTKLDKSEEYFFQYAGYQTDEQKLTWSKKVIFNANISGIIYGLYEYFKLLAKNFTKSFSIENVKNSIINKGIVDTVDKIDHLVFEEELDLMLNDKINAMKIESNAKINNLLALLPK